MDLTAEQGRVLGSLTEKSLSTPQQYPLTLNALVAACNQASNRDPVVHYDEPQVLEALQSLKGLGLVRFVHPSHGRSVVRYRAVIHEVLALDDRAQALLGVLLLRGPQTVGELRSRTERLAAFDSLHDVEAELGRLAERQEPVVRRLTRRPGQKEERWAQQVAAEATGLSPVPDSAVPGDDERAAVVPLAPPPSIAEHPSAVPAGNVAILGNGQPAAEDTAGAAPPAGAAWAGSSAGSSGAPPASGHGDTSGGGRELAEVRAEVAALAAEVTRLRGDLDELRRSLGG